MTDTPTQLRFDDGKEPEALRTIGEVASALDIKQHVLRYWEQQFPMLRPLKRSGGRRYYRPEDVELLSKIDRLINKEGYTLKGARQALTNAPSAGKDTPDESVAAGAADFLPQLRAIRDRLAHALA